MEEEEKETTAEKLEVLKTFDMTKLCEMYTIQHPMWNGQLEAGHATSKEHADECRTRFGWPVTGQEMKSKVEDVSDKRLTVEGTTA
jgi:hypothetical protein